jgi:zinc and cadmium transporter
MTTYLYTFISVGIVSLISLLGVFSLSLKEEFFRKYIFLFISVAVGALLGDAFIHLIPEALEGAAEVTNTSILIILGILIFFIVEKFIHWHHHGEDENDNAVHPVGKLILFSDGVHNFIDGVVIAASFAVSVPIGIASTIAVILHEIPQEIGDFAVLIHAGYTKTRAIWINFLSALTSIAGAIFLFILGDTALLSSSVFLPMAAGGFIYIAIADLIPELHKTKEVKYSILQILAILLGVLVMIALTFLE